MSEQLTDTDFVRVCRLDELPPVGAALAEVEGRRVSIVRTDDGTVCGLEALVRWEHPTHGLLTPAQFLGLAEENHLLGRIDAWALGEGMAALARWAAPTTT